MPAQLTPSSNIKSLFVCIFTLASVTFFLTPSAKATTWTISVKPADKNTLSYEVDPPVGGCPSMVQDPMNLRICDGDIVLWKAVFPGSHTAKTLKMWVFHEDFILDDEDGDPTLGFHAVNTDTTTGGMTDSAATWGIKHKYHVSVFERSNGKKKTYHDDPTIIIGGTPLATFIDFVKKDCAQLLPQIEKDKDLKDPDDKIKDQVRAGCKQFEAIKPVN
jgi:hypothetical protein